MKIRFGVGTSSGAGPAEFAALVDSLEAAGVDSLWLSELVSADSVEPFVGMAFALSRTTRLKVGTSVAILPGRHPVLVAKQLASLAGLAPKRVLPVFGLQPARPGERDLFPVPPGRRGAMFDESLRLLRAALDYDEVDFDGEFFTVGGIGIGARPPRPLDIWLGGSAPAAYRRIGRYADGWLGSFLTPAEAAQGRKAIEAAAAEAGREIEADHFGTSVVLAEDGIPDDLAAAIVRRRPGVDPADLIAGSWPDLHRLIDGYLEAGLTKFVVGSVSGRPAEEFVGRFVEELLPRQN
ncbi:TIGR03854 family LLM class F420-dependent oxidoreductase [Nocardia blacklockiae]|uniref:TIGR03854 family LLM class F420-dependent oxidoreductase n=1 Tax=Nocardia blacklockiae TaxID=480036 RepID=UPI001893650E|nr:TIGR03854 family LLM class F420-dependent oxidoreductase [Nocardia blacklockiae]MBF6174054.1 TIGR03854 family LLM class F420-dependent oxidoreductase [Nocardia blacklockiae]